MREIVVDDERIMIRKFVRLSEGMEDLNIVATFESPEEALAYAQENNIEVAFLDVDMPVMDGLELAEELRKIRKDILIVFITAYDNFVCESNKIGGDDYIGKPYTREMLEIMMQKLRLLARRQHKTIYVQMFGRFLVSKDEKPVRLTGKAKEILALIATRRGREISNEEIYSTIWEGRAYGSESMTVYYNALRRLKHALNKAGLASLLISTSRGQMVNTDMFDCDYYAWQDRKMDTRDRFRGDFLSEYSWGEYMLAEIMKADWH